MWVATVAALAAVGCVVITGAADLEIDRADGGALSDADGGSSPNEPGTSDASSSPPAADAEADAARAGVRCNDTECAGICCVSFEGTAACIPDGQDCPAMSLQLSCDERADCPMGLSCCLFVVDTSRPTSSCASACTSDGALVLCAGDAECPERTECVPLTGLELPPGNGKGACD